MYSVYSACSSPSSTPERYLLCAAGSRVLRVSRPGLRTLGVWSTNYHIIRRDSPLPPILASFHFTSPSIFHSISLLRQHFIPFQFSVNIPFYFTSLSIFHSMSLLLQYFIPFHFSYNISFNFTSPLTISFNFISPSQFLSISLLRHHFNQFHFSSRSTLHPISFLLQHFIFYSSHCEADPVYVG